MGQLLEGQLNPMDNKILIKKSGIRLYFLMAIFNFGIMYIFLSLGGIIGLYDTGLPFTIIALFLLVVVVVIFKYKDLKHPVVLYGIPIAIAFLIIREIYGGQLTLNLITIVFLCIGRAIDYRVINEGKY